MLRRGEESSVHRALTACPKDIQEPCFPCVRERFLKESKLGRFTRKVNRVKQRLVRLEVVAEQSKLAPTLRGRSLIGYG